MRSLIESIICYMVKALAFVMRIFPHGVALSFGVFLGKAAYLFSSKRKLIAYNNLRIAFCASKTDEELRLILKKSYEHFGQAFIEMLRLPLIGRTGFKKLVTLEGEEHIREAISRGKGVIFLAMHSGNWELSSLVGSMVGYPYSLIANPQKRTSKLDDLLNAYRTAAGCKIILPGKGTRDILRRLKLNEIVTFVADQGGHDGELVNFWGRQASMSTGAIRLALKYGVAVCLCDIHREKDGHHRLIVDQPIDLVRTGREEHDLEVNLTNVVHQFEKKISEHPQEYMWFYKIWKYSENMNIVILDDEKTGHLRQSEAVSSGLKDKLSARGKKVNLQKVRVVFKNDFMKRACSLIAVLGQVFKGLRSNYFLRIFLTSESFRALTAIKADYFVSCGSSAAYVNFLSMPWNMARSITILKPGLLSLKSFDLVVLPQHDKSPDMHPSARLVFTRIAPNLINDKYLKEQECLLLSRYSHLKNSYRTKIGVLIGGNTKNVEFTESIIKIILHQIKEVATQLNADILLTTSRRTPENVEQIIWKELKKFDHSVLLISAANNNVPEAVGGILSLSDYMVVSGESISMVSEAVSSAKKTVVFRVSGSGIGSAAGKNKYEQFVDQLHQQGHLISCAPKDVGQELYNVMRDKIRIKTLNDHEVLDKALEKIV